jgi:deoxyribonuclease V
VVSVELSHDWPETAESALAIQQELRGRVRIEPLTEPVRTVAGLDVGYEPGTDRQAAAVVVLDAETLTVLDSSIHFGQTIFPYVPGLFAFRELPGLIAALAGLSVRPDLLLCDGQGVAHPRRFGLACHLGVLTGLPTIGVAKSPLGQYTAPGLHRGEHSPLHDGAEAVGSALRTRDLVKPVFVSAGHLIDLAGARAEVLRDARDFRLPEAIRLADRYGREALRGERPATSGEFDDDFGDPGDDDGDEFGAEIHDETDET